MWKRWWNIGAPGWKTGSLRPDSLRDEDVQRDHLPILRQSSSYHLIIDSDGLVIGRAGSGSDPHILFVYMKEN